VPRPVRRLALVLALAACGDPVEPGTAGDDPSATAAESTADPPADPPAPTTGGADDPAGTMGHGESASTGEPACDPAALELTERGFIPQGDGGRSAELPACGEDRWYVALPSESSWELRLTRTSGQSALSAVVAYPDEPPPDVWQAALAPPLVSGQASAQAIFAVPRSGEFAIHVRSDMPDEPAAYDLELTCVLGCERETTRFPLVLVHGWTGFEAIGPLTYFYGTKVDLEDLGFPVEIAVLDPYNHTLIRSGQLGDQLDDFLLFNRARKVDLIGHSQGGVDSRAVVSTHGYGDRVSAVVTIASPHRGTYIMDLALGLAPGPIEDALALLLNFVGAVTAQQKSDAIESFHSLSEAHMQGEFNPNNPDDPRVKYISYTGRTCDALGFLDPDKDCLDLVHPLIGWGYTLLDAARGDNDGLVTVESAMWGEYRGEMIADHLNEVGQLAGITDPKFDHHAWYVKLARDLAAEEH
jgi:triacylglycerol esterase/lipase EstA (alpha/beta hydrolase family)